MAYDNQGAAVGAAGHYAAAITAALITSGAIDNSADAMETFEGLLTDTFNACEALKGTLPEQPKSSGSKSNYRPKSNNSGGGNSDPGTLDFRTGKHAGSTIADVYASDPEYLDWCSGNLKNDFMRGKIQEFLETAV